MAAARGISACPGGVFINGRFVRQALPMGIFRKEVHIGPIMDSYCSGCYPRWIASRRRGLSMKRRQFLTAATAMAGVSAESGMKPLFAQTAGKPVEKRTIITSTAQFDPARPEMAKLVAQAAKAIGWEVEANPIDYNEGVQKVMMQHEYDMWILSLA